MFVIVVSGVVEELFTTSSELPVVFVGEPRKSTHSTGEDLLVNKLTDRQFVQSVEVKGLGVSVVGPGELFHTIMIHCSLTERGNHVTLREVDPYAV